MAIWMGSSKLELGKLRVSRFNSVFLVVVFLLLIAHTLRDGICLSITTITCASSPA